MEIPIEKERLFRILDDIAYGSDDTKPYEGSRFWSLAFVYHDDEAVKVLKDLGFVDLKCGEKILNHIHDVSKNLGLREQPGFAEVHLKNEFLTQVGLALFREHDEDTD